MTRHYGGPACDRPVCPSPCENGGACVPGGACLCPTGFIGASCSAGVRDESRKHTTTLRPTRSSRIHESRIAERRFSPVGVGEEGTPSSSVACRLMSSGGLLHLSPPAGRGGRCESIKNGNSMGRPQE